MEMLDFMTLNKIFYSAFYFLLVYFEIEGRKGNLFYDHPYNSHVYFANIQENILVLINSMKYELILFSKDGNVLSKIVNDEKPLTLTKEEDFQTFA